ncbi:PhzF family phenazine biosynthesis protein [Microbacterium sp. B2969]|uniref:PhzF family phenazine biosynthesis protein n=1 Tax=Microbacterium alkaliflavum TaxID=3248839 RepID=A0ABW7QB63_9MICO
MTEVLRYAAFVDGAEGGGNPAGVVPDAGALTDAEMLAIAAEVGYSETAFLTGPADDGRRGIRYFSPIAEVPFCGHATIATAVALAEREGTGEFRFATPVGEVVIDTRAAAGGGVEASFTSVDPDVDEVEPGTLDRLLDILGLAPDALAIDFPPRISFAGNRHPILAVERIETFDAFTFDPAALRALMDAEDWAGTVTVMHRRTDEEWEARNPFPVGEITEDPATGSAAAAFGAYLRAFDRVPASGKVVIHQGRHVGRPSVLRVQIPADGGITVSGGAAPIG